MDKVAGFPTENYIIPVHHRSTALCQLPTDDFYYPTQIFLDLFSYCVF